MKAIGNRKTSLDIVRITACYLVCSVHFFLNTNFYTYPLDTPKMYFYTALRSGCMICVPLFLVLSGYLMNKKTASLRYYWGLEKTLLTYLLACLMCMFYKKYNIHWQIHAADILNFTAAPYAWYVEMYIGLFLLIPFLNIVWNSLDTKNKKRGLVLTFLLLTALPSVLNTYQFDAASWWAKPSVSAAYLKIFPAWWTAFYPVTYYYIGAYLREFPTRFKKYQLFALVLLTAAGYGAYNCYRSYGSAFVWGDWQNWGALPLVLLTVLVFRFIESFDMNRLPNFIRWLFARISDLCLGTYLLSWIFDNNFYTFLNERVPEIPDRMKYFFIIPPLVFLIASAFSAVVYIIMKITHFLIPIGDMINKREEKKQAKIHPNS